MTYPLLVGETTAVMWKATGHGWNPLEKIMCSLCLRKEFQFGKEFDFGLDFDFIGEQGVVISTLRVILPH